VLWTRRTFGFDRDAAKVKVVRAEAAVLRSTATKVLAGESMARIVADLNARGITTTTGAAWHITSLRRALLNPRLHGRVIYKGEDMGDGGPVILDRDTADRLSAILRDPRRRMSPSTQVKYLMSGLLICGRPECGDRMLATSNKGVMIYRCTTCYGTRRMALVDEVVMGTIIGRLSRPDAICCSGTSPRRAALAGCRAAAAA